MRKIIVAKGLCSPARDAVVSTLAPYGVRFSIYAYSEGPDGVNAEENKPTAYWNVAEVTVNDAAAAWAEYLLCRSGIFTLRSKPIDARNLKWAVKWGGAMPAPWVESGCKVPSKAPQPTPAGKRSNATTDRRRSEPAGRPARGNRKERY